MADSLVSVEKLKAFAQSQYYDEEKWALNLLVGSFSSLDLRNEKGTIVFFSHLLDWRIQGMGDEFINGNLMIWFPTGDGTGRWELLVVVEEWWRGIKVPTEGDHGVYRVNGDEFTSGNGWHGSHSHSLQTKTAMMLVLFSSEVSFHDHLLFCVMLGEIAACCRALRRNNCPDAELW
ncbi:hypothetical protein FH972_019344 [Carpinus fangiana]|uniref:Uncharacterized protein n=1 Tax=Carpinus fangiana TaxID=176857 RepID=A0A5N6RSU3_9ROSI|nr:hypothetical protein FH972_019344 [Carpinus fangiana]